MNILVLGETCCGKSTWFCYFFGVNKVPEGQCVQFYARRTYEDDTWDDVKVNMYGLDDTLKHEPPKDPKFYDAFIIFGTKRYLKNNEYLKEIVGDCKNVWVVNVFDKLSPEDTDYPIVCSWKYTMHQKQRKDNALDVYYNTLGKFFGARNTSECITELL